MAPDLTRPPSPGPEPARHGAILAGDASSRARPLRAWSSAELGRVADAVAGVLRAWRADWGLPAPEEARDGIRCETLFGAAARGLRAEELAWATGPGAPGWSWAADARARRAGLDGPERALSLALFGEVADPAPDGAAAASAAPGAIAAEVAAQAWRDAWRRLAERFGAPRGASDAGGPSCGAAVAWSGAALVTVPWWGAPLLLLVDGETCARAARPGAATSPPRLGGLSPLAPALATEAAQLQAVLEPFELELAALVTLRPGDVVRTAHRLDAPLSLAVAGGDGGLAVVCEGFLGQVCGWRAIEVASDGAGARSPARAPERSAPGCT